MLILGIACGGAAGAVLRYVMVSWAMALFGRGFPWGTLLVNVIGSFAIGALFVWFASRGPHLEVLRASLVIGVLGGFTTFSAFSMETLNLAMTGQPVRAGLNVLLNVTLCIAAAGVGMQSVKSFLL